MIPKLAYLEKYKSGSEEKVSTSVLKGKVDSKVTVIDEDLKSSAALQLRSQPRPPFQENKEVKRRRYDSSDDESQLVGIEKKRRYDSDEEAEVILDKKRRYDSDEDEFNGKIPSIDQENSASLDGRNAQTVFRDSYGLKIDPPMTSKSIEERKRQEEHEKRELLLGKVQKEEESKMANELLKVSQAPFSRRTGDVELETFLKSKVRDGDPMAKLLSQQPKNDAEGSRKVYQGPMAQPNRFGILPGHRWDGVDRGNNWENTLLLARSSKRSKGK
jgi:Pre-mRNA-splicing factor of RES complex